MLSSICDGSRDAAQNTAQNIKMGFITKNQNQNFFPNFQINLNLTKKMDKTQ